MGNKIFTSFAHQSSASKRREIAAGIKLVARIHLDDDVEGGMRGRSNGI